KYHVRWAGYSREHDTWEPVDEFNQTCERLCKSFWTEVGNDDQEDYPVGHELKATAKWIAREQQLYAEGYKKEQERKKRREAKRAEKAKTKSSVKQGKSKAGDKSSPEIKSSELSRSSSRTAARAVSSNEDVGSNFPRVIDETYFPQRKTKRARPSDPHEVDPLSSLFTPTPSPVKTQNHSSPGAPGGSPSKIVSRAPASSKSPAIPISVQSTTNTSERKNATPRTATKVINDPQLVVNGNSTKHRIFQQSNSGSDAGALSSSLSAHSSSLAGLKFTKKKAVFPPPTQAGVSSAAVPTKSSRKSQHPTPITSRDSHLQLQPGPLPRPQSNSPVDYELWSSRKQQAPVYTDTSQVVDSKSVEEFLHSAMPEGLISSRPSPENESWGIPGIVNQLNKPGVVGTSKKYQWSGILNLQTMTRPFGVDAPTTGCEDLCKVRISDVTRARQGGVQFSYFLKEDTQSLQVLSTHNLTDLYDLLSACTPITQMARLGPADDEDRDVFEMFVGYLIRKRQILLIPMRLDAIISGHILVFPPALGNLAQRFNVPTELRTSTHSHAIAALLPWKLTASERDEMTPTMPSTFLAGHIKHEQFLTDKTRWANTIGGIRGRYQLALRVLRFPKILHDYLAETHPATFIWFDGGDGDRGVNGVGAGIQTMLLYSILERCNARPTRKIDEARIVLVHVGALRWLKSIPGLATVKRERPDIAFYTYGSHERIPVSRWGVTNIFPFGGVVTLSVKCLSETMVATHKVVESIIDHPLWDCYILPQVLGAAATVISPGLDPLQALERGNFALEWLLDFILEGKVSLTSSPPHTFNPTEDKDSVHEWTMRQVTMTSTDAQGLLRYTLQQYHASMANIPPVATALREGRLDTEIEVDLLNLQLHPIIYQERRRFVVLSCAESAAKQKNKQTGLEWLTPRAFDFKDEFLSV
ncbi:hypothetical protein DL96DRAFT_1601932, partial [Flagelloscypha sp. PMI_526]